MYLVHVTKWLLAQFVFATSLIVLELLAQLYGG